uniref:Uncharacterized protein n=1 Tax=Arundo donax TaxID=35708 RepID=A0A0A9ECR4_ARUDO
MFCLTTYYFLSVFTPCLSQFIVLYPFFWSF